MDKANTKDQKAGEDSTDEGLSSNLKGIASLLIFLHLFALGVAIISNSPASSFERKLRRTPLITSYLQAFYMDTNYRYYMTLQELGDISWTITINTKAPGLEDRNFTFPNAETQSTSKVLPYHYLAQRLYELDYNSDEENESIRNNLIISIGQSQFDNVVKELLSKYDAGEKDSYIQRAEAGKDWEVLKKYDRDKDQIISGLEIYQGTEVSVECNGLDLLTPEQFANNEVAQIFDQFKVFIKPIDNGNGTFQFSIFSPVANNIESAPAAVSSDK